VFVSLQGPADEKIILPDSTKLLAEAEAALHANVAPYQDIAVASSLMKTKPTPGKIVSETKNETLGITEITFANGAKAILKPTTFKDDEISMNAFRKGGSNSYGAADKQNVQYVAGIVQQMGVAGFSPTDLSKMLAGKTASATPGIQQLTARINGSSSVKDFETMLQLTNLYITNPRVDTALFKAWRDKNKSATQFTMADPQAAFVDTFYQTMYQKNPLAPIPVPQPADFDAVNLDRAMAIYNEQFGNAKDFNFIFVGSFDVEKIKPLLAMYIGSLPSTDKAASYKDNGLRRINGNVNLTVHKGTEAKSLVIEVYSGEATYSEDLDMKAKALADIIQIKVDEDLREKMSAIYSGGFYGGANKLPYNNYAFVAQLPCGPEHVDTVIKAMNAEIDSIKKYGPSQINLDKVKKAWIETYKTDSKENGYWSNQLQDIYLQGTDPQRILNYETLVNALTVEDIKAIANKLFDGKNIFTAVLQPEK